MGCSQAAHQEVVPDAGVISLGSVPMWVDKGGASELEGSECLYKGKC